jgi:alanine dehydrogenase
LNSQGKETAQTGAKSVLRYSGSQISQIAAGRASVRTKIGIVGAGMVGGTTAQRLAERNYADIVLLDIPAAERMAQGKALDIQESGPIYGYETKLRGVLNTKIYMGAQLWSSREALLASQA